MFTNFCTQVFPKEMDGPRYQVLCTVQQVLMVVWPGVDALDIVNEEISSEVLVPPALKPSDVDAAFASDSEDGQRRRVKNLTFLLLTAAMRRRYQFGAQAWTESIKAAIATTFFRHEDWLHLTLAPTPELDALIRRSTFISAHDFNDIHRIGGRTREILDRMISLFEASFRSPSPTPGDVMMSRNPLRVPQWFIPETESDGLENLFESSDELFRTPAVDRRAVTPVSPRRVESVSSSPIRFRSIAEREANGTLRRRSDVVSPVSPTRIHVARSQRSFDEPDEDITPMPSPRRALFQSPSHSPTWAERNPRRGSLTPLWNESPASSPSYLPNLISQPVSPVRSPRRDSYRTPPRSPPPRSTALPRPPVRARPDSENPNLSHYSDFSGNSYYTGYDF